MKRIALLILKWTIRQQQSKPDFTIGAEHPPYLRRWWLLPRNPFFNAYLHHFQRSDDDRAHHDHAYLFNLSLILKGFIVEQTIAAGGVLRMRSMQAGDWRFRWGRSPHRLEIMEGGPGAWTIFITGPRVREWGFHCPQGWVPWFKFTDPKDSGKIGKGCG